MKKFALKTKVKQRVEPIDVMKWVSISKKKIDLELGTNRYRA